MSLRALLLFLALCLCACSGPSLSGGDIRSAGQKCLKETDDWLAKPDDTEQLSRALKASKLAKSNFERDEKASKQVLFGDIDLLFGALNMAKMGSDDGQDPTRPSSMSDIPVVASVRLVADQLREHLAASPNPDP